MEDNTLIIKLMEYIFIFIAIEIIVGFFVLMYIIDKTNWRGRVYCVYVISVCTIVHSFTNLMHM